MFATVGHVNKNDLNFPYNNDYTLNIKSGEREIERKGGRERKKKKNNEKMKTKRDTRKKLIQNYSRSTV